MASKEAYQKVGVEDETTIEAEEDEFPQISLDEDEKPQLCSTETTQSSNAGPADADASSLLKSEDTSDFASSNAFGLTIKGESQYKEAAIEMQEIATADSSFNMNKDDLLQRSQTGFTPSTLNTAPVEKKEKKKSKAKKPKSTMIRYPTQCMRIGEIKCLFLSCYDRGQSPVLTLGPSWPFTIFLLFFAGMILVYFAIMISMAKNANPIHLNACYGALGLNLLILFTGILKNPGIPKPIILRYLKERLGKSQTGEGDLSDNEDQEEDADLENGGTQDPSYYPKTDQYGKKTVYCRQCQYHMTSDMYHCEDCEICIEDYDHHCVFFSKCIGGGNIIPFWGTMVMLLVNFVLVATMVAMTAYNETGSTKGKGAQSAARYVEEAAAKQVADIVQSVVGQLP